LCSRDKDTRFPTPPPTNREIRCLRPPQANWSYALLHLRDANRAEDAVQETLLAAIEDGERFGGRASLKTWLTGILKHKITDLFRKQSRESQAPVAAEGEDEREFADQFFDQARRDYWHTFPPTWEDPERCFEQKRFWEVFERCAAQLPPQTAVSSPCANSWEWRPKIFVGKSGSPRPIAG
jgi:RNA polymerase sigma-70 factor (ECF subfamily)